MTLNLCDICQNSVVEDGFVCDICEPPLPTRRRIAVGRITPAKGGVRQFIRKSVEVHEIPGQKDYVSRSTTSWYFFAGMGPIDGEFDHGGSL